MVTFFWYVILGGIAVATAVIWFILERRIKAEELAEQKVEPDLNEFFSELDEEEPSLKEEGERGEQVLEASVREEELFAGLEALDPIEKEPAVAADDPFIAPDEPQLLSQESSEEFSAVEIENAASEEREVAEKSSPATGGFIGRVKRLFGGKEEQKRDDDGFAVDPDTGERIIRRPDPVETVALILVAPEEQPYLGYEVLEVAEEHQLMQCDEGFIKHVTTTHYGNETTYSIAHLLHPGSFKIDGIEEMELPGLLFFANIPGPDPEIDTISNLIDIAARYGSTLGGTLYHEDGEIATKESLAKLYQEKSTLDSEEWDRAISEYY